MRELFDQIYFFNLINDIPPYLSYFLAVFSSVCAGLAIGWDREQSNKAAGIRTFALVCLGSTLFTLIAKELNTADSVSRIIGQIVSGIGFIGAGAVFRGKSKVSGLTTAAGIWVCSAVGVIFGLGFLPFGVLISLFIIVLFRLQRKTELWLYGPCERQTLEISFLDKGHLNSIKLMAALNGFHHLNLRMGNQSESKYSKVLVDCCGNHKNHRDFLGVLAEMSFIEEINPPPKF